jgi:hypothetical protein
MADSIIDRYKGSEFENVGKSNKDQTPISADNVNKLHIPANELDRVRGGAVSNSKKYSDTVNYGN